MGTSLIVCTAQDTCYRNSTQAGEHKVDRHIKIADSIEGTGSFLLCSGESLEGQCTG